MDAWQERLMHLDLIPVQPRHCGQIVRRLRAAHQAAIGAARMNLHRELRLRLSQSYYARALLIDGELVGLGGLAGTMLDPTAFAWIVLTEEAKRHSLRIVRLLRRELDAVMVHKRELAALLVPADHEAVRLAVFLGFHVRDQGLGSVATCKRERIALRRYLESEIELRVRFQGLDMIPVGYHQEAA
jgi:hypothetical protein